jgi:hypothetical protein
LARISICANSSSLITEELAQMEIRAKNKNERVADDCAKHTQLCVIVVKALKIHVYFECILSKLVHFIKR